jgi:nuclease HARBI1
MTYNRSQSSLSEIINELCIYLDNHWSHLLDFDHHHLLSPANLARYSAAIYEAGAPQETIFAFIDCTFNQMCRPTWWQRQAYTGHKKYHALKFQALCLPNGLFGHLFGPEEGRRNDNYLAEKSRVFEWAREHAFREGADETTPIVDRYYQIFGDPAYGMSPVLSSPFQGEKTEEEQEWNYRMSGVRISVEHGFGGVLTAWPFLRAFWKHRVYSSPVGRYYRVAVLLYNAISCFRPNATSQRYDCMPPSVEEYFHH